MAELLNIIIWQMLAIQEWSDLPDPPFHEMQNYGTHYLPMCGYVLDGILQEMYQQNFNSLIPTHGSGSCESLEF